MHLRRILTEAAERGLPVRARGTGRALGRVGDLDGVQVAMRPHFHAVRLLEARIDGRPSIAVRAEAGATVAEVLAVIAQRDRTLPNVPGFDELSLVGATITGSHGTGLRLPPFCDMVLAVEAMLLDPDRGVRQVVVTRPDVDPESLPLPIGTEILDEPELFDAIRVGGWWLGVVVAMTFETRPRYLLEETRQLVSWDRAREQLPAVLDDPDVEGVTLWLNPYAHDATRQAALTLYRRHAGPARGRRSFASRHGGRLLFRKVVPWLMRAAPPCWRPQTLHCGLQLTAMRGPAILPSHQALSFGSPNRLTVTSSEVGVDVRDTIAVAEGLLDHYDRLRRMGLWTSAPISLRFTAASSALLAPQQGRASCMVEQVLNAGTAHAIQIHDAFQELLRQQADGRCHWGQHLSAPAAELVRRLPGRRAFVRQLRRHNSHGLLGRELHPLLDHPRSQSSCPGQTTAS